MLLLEGYRRRVSSAHARRRILRRIWCPGRRGWMRAGRRWKGRAGCDRCDTKNRCTRTSKSASTNASIQYSDYGSCFTICREEGEEDDGPEGFVLGRDKGEDFGGVGGGGKGGRKGEGEE